MAAVGWLSMKYEMQYPQFDSQVTFVARHSYLSLLLFLTSSL